MKNFKSHFWYSKSQRNGILFLFVVIILAQALYFFVDFSFDELQNTNHPELLTFQKEIDSLKIVELENRKPKLYPFNPNYITDFKGYQLGMSVNEIDRLHSYRKQNKFVNSVKEFQQVTKVHDTLLNKIATYFKFPDWVVKRNQKKDVSFSNKENSYSKKKYPEKVISTNDINKATAEDLTIVNGIGEKLSQRIIKYRSRLKGFSYPEQLYEVWNIEPEVIKRVLQTFKIITEPIIEKINVNTATFKEVLKNPYIDYELCKKIFDYRDEVAELQNISELKNIEGFPVNKYERIILYLEAK
ncbi:DNA uptake protein ComE-like DNA-binding protein [Tenacibaculum adriaticum]|uniref:DNA uptake protein ComE-like DNA-binding protein n=1 Tax=Tenacibaculum adriaticum TaxID=413713 RepID=A0A5S5DNM7_9FLAO|nr:helix-hairpin-helix domain-containing protein [Tenacibaculum adriaticum]TYP97517.1 DNA uptake protein ComE-like DNA-binding protein [Tenacibaculum adriaticum]